MSYRYWTLTDTSPASAITAVGLAGASGLDEYDYVRVDASLVGGTGGVLDVYLQRMIRPNVWADWLHFTQLSAAATAKYSVICAPGLSTTITASNLGTDAAPGVTLASATFLGGHPGKSLRSVYVAGAGTSAGAINTIYISAWRADR